MQLYVKPTPMYTDRVHIYQKHILDLLRGADTLRYSELQPDGVESSHFKYHLDQLIKDSLVTQVSRGTYSLTPAGSSAVDRLSRDKINPDLTPKVITYTLIHDTDYYYLLRKDKDPYRGLLNFVGGKVHQGETTQQAAIREVREKTGIDTEHPSLAGTAEIIITHNSALLTHAIAYIYTAVLPNSTDHTTAPLERVSKSEATNLSNAAPDFADILRATNTSTVPFAVTLKLNY